MTATIPDLILILILVLPGFLSYRTALARSVDAARRSTLWQLSAMLEFSVYIHTIGLCVFVGVALIVKRLFDIQLHYTEMPASGLEAYVAGFPGEAAVLIVFYLLYVLVAAELLGAYNFPHWMASRVSKSASFLAKRVWGLPRPHPANPEQPVWYDAFHIATNSYADGQPRLVVRMNSGDSYFGELAAYAILPDEHVAKDFLLRKALYFPANRPGTVIDLASDGEGGGTVLLNTSNVDSIQVYYAPRDMSGQPATSSS